MTALHRFPWQRRLRRRIKEWIGAVLRVTLGPFRKGRLAVIAGAASPDQVEEVKRRVELALAVEGSRAPQVLVRESATLRALLMSETVVLAHSQATSAAVRRVLPSVFDLDFRQNPIDGWALAEMMASRASAVLRQERHNARGRFLTHLARLRARGPRPVYLFGTGPSLPGAIGRDFRDGHVVVCNTIVKDSALWDHLAPDILVAGDAIYHFGHTAHARAFRRDAHDRLRAAHGRTVFIYPEIFHPLVAHEFADVAEHLIPIPFGEHTDVTVNLAEDFSLPALGNVLNLLLLPVGCTLSREVRLWGFDGRAPTDQGFWANAGGQAYLDLMPGIRQAHPAFFEALVPTGRESDYVKSVHGEALEQRMAQAEAQGIRFEMLHFSWTPTLRRRYRGPLPPGVE